VEEATSLEQCAKKSVRDDDVRPVESYRNTNRGKYVKLDYIVLEEVFMRSCSIITFSTRPENCICLNMIYLLVYI